MFLHLFRSHISKGLLVLRFCSCHGLHSCLQLNCVYAFNLHRNKYPNAFIQNTTALFTRFYPRCTTDHRWRPPGDPGAGGYVPACQLALLSLTSQQIHQPVETRRRFLTATASGHFKDLLVQTPRRYSHQCKTWSKVVVVISASSHICVNRQSKVMYHCGCHA